MFQLFDKMKIWYRQLLLKENKPSKVPTRLPFLYHSNVFELKINNKYQNKFC